MRIKIGKVFKNKTLKYVLPMLKKYYDDTLVSPFKFCWDISSRDWRFFNRKRIQTTYICIN